MTKPVRIGDIVEDRISKFTGVTTGRTEYLNGCRQFLVRPQGLDGDGKQKEGVWIDEQNLSVIQAQMFTDPFEQRTPATAGGPDRPARSNY